MSILPLVALKPVIFMTLRSAPRSAIRFAKRSCNLLSEAALQHGRAVTGAYLMGMGVDTSFLSAEDRLRRERDY